MVKRHQATRPAPFDELARNAASPWLLPVVALDWGFEWAAFVLGKWAFLEVLEYLGKFSVLIAVIFYFVESGDRIKQRHYQAWQVINTAQGKGGNGGRIEALQELNADKVPLVGVDVSSAFLQGLNLEHANLLRSDFSSADLRNSRLAGVDFTLATLNTANLRGAILDGANCAGTDLRNADLEGARLTAASLSGTMLDNADLQGADITDIRWQQLKSLKGANIAGVRNAPAGFVKWALDHGAVDQPAPDQ